MVPPGHSELNASSSGSSTHLPFIARIHLEDDLMSCLAFFTKFTHPTTAIVSVKCSCSTYDTHNMTLLVRDSINVKNVVPIPSLCVENLDRTMFRGRDSQGIRQVFVESQDIHFQPSS